MARRLTARTVPIFLAALTAVAAAPAPPAPAATSPPEPLVTSAWLADRLGDPDLVLAHVGPAGSFEREHLPGARPLSVRALLTTTPAGIRDELPPLDELRSVLAAAGVRDESTVVVYVADDTALPYAARVFFTLEYAGLGGRVAVLDGGLPGWKAEGRPLSTETAPVAAGSPTLTPHPEVVADADWLAGQLDRPAVALLDARPPEQYAGTATHSMATRPGHIPAAVNLPFYTLTEDDAPSRFKSRDEMARLFAEAGAMPDRQVVVYCGTGIWASPLYLAARHLGLPVRLYDGSYQEWGSDESRPIVAPVSKSQLR